MPGDNIGQKILSKESVDMCLSSLLSFSTYIQKREDGGKKHQHHPLKNAMIFSKVQFIFKDFSQNDMDCIYKSVSDHETMMGSTISSILPC